MLAAHPQPRNNLIHLHRDRGYRFVEKDPVLQELAPLITASGLSFEEICDKVLAASKSYRPSPATLACWMNGTTKRPQNFIVTWVAYALGYERKWTKLKGARQ
jgi:hypothetical protein